MEMEPEIKAMNDIYQILNDLGEQDARQRVMDWIIKRFSLSNNVNQSKKSDPNDESPDSPKDKNFSSFESVADVFANANLKTSFDRVLVAAAFLQDKNGGRELTGREINQVLTHLGHGVKNITDAIGYWIGKKPQLMIQTRKEGKTRQAQKKYKVTSEGVVAALKMIRFFNQEESL